MSLRRPKPPIKRGSVPEEKEEPILKVIKLFVNCYLSMFIGLFVDLGMDQLRPNVSFC